MVRGAVRRKRDVSLHPPPPHDPENLGSSGQANDGDNVRSTKRSRTTSARKHEMEMRQAQEEKKRLEHRIKQLEKNQHKESNQGLNDGDDDELGPESEDDIEQDGVIMRVSPFVTLPRFIALRPSFVALRPSFITLGPSFVTLPSGFITLPPFDVALPFFTITLPSRVITPLWSLKVAIPNPPAFLLPIATHRIAPPTKFAALLKTHDTGTDKKSGFAESQVIQNAIQLTFFGNPEASLGFRFPDRFNPIPNEVLAFLMTVVRGHIAEWSTGKQVRETFKSGGDSGHGKHYRSFLADLKSYERAGPSTWKNIRTRMYNKAFRAGGGVDPTTTNACISSAAMDEATRQLEARTGLTDSESEPDG
ncbi:uncharacterized protein BXZ73DRAFT_109653 [Epithele typhae]|uniref:uncharacterized protein n=1 Tax=Epithele typhae TaxID=378194 RepID=UPI0020079A3C|nr:uncharacterized protein BXZ73DRAFT_109653 [Epithele typhae]KAH9909443.1 hypothetical protein BXZ73DRAFT_109653 [Epithele typhae]